MSEPAGADPTMDDVSAAVDAAAEAASEELDTADTSAVADASMLGDTSVGSETAEAEAPDAEQIVTLSELLDEQKAMDLEYAAVLGGSDHKSCTYAKGYIKRQALYACLTCTPDARTDPAQRAGICLACSYGCHEGHELIELYTKRAFRCDCGTARILAVRCRLDEHKLDANDANRYNQNFSGLYCTCHRPYPDAEDPVEDEMIQCVVCEDWFHCRHLAGGGGGTAAATVPSTGDFSEMVCAGCMEANAFLEHYVGFSVTVPGKVVKKVARRATAAASAAVKDEDEENKKKEAADESAEVDVVDGKLPPPPEENSKDGQFTDEINQCIQDILEINKSSGLGEEVDGDVDAQLAAPPPTKKQKLNDATERATAAAAVADDVKDEKPPPSVGVDEAAKTCRKPRLPEPIDGGDSDGGGATFWPDGWRSHLCDCAVCTLQMQRKRVAFLLDEEDTVRAYEEKGIARATADDEDASGGGGEHREYDRAMSALAQLDHGSQIDMIVGYNKLKEKLTEFLRGFVANEQVVTEADIKRFFRMMREGGGKAESGGVGGAASAAEKNSKGE